MYDIFTNNNQKKWIFSGTGKIERNGVIILYLAIIPFNRQITLIEKRELFHF
jgi:hypothetical protein